jgi:PTS system cellobiose-specific IIB component
MFRILLLCSGGTSTSFLVLNIKKAAKAKNIEVEAAACPEHTLKRNIDDFDVILLAPQARYSAERVNKICQEHKKAFALIPGNLYGSMNGPAVLDLAINSEARFRKDQTNIKKEEL